MAAIVVVLAASGCPAGDDGESAGSAGTGDSSGDVDGSGSTSTTSTGSTESATTSTVSTEPTDSSSSATDSGPDSCTDLACADDEYCDFQFNECGTGDEDLFPLCASIPTFCDSDDPPACGCDGVVYPDECSAAAAGVDLDVTGGCEPPPDLFVCGPKFCDPTASYCARTDGLGGSSYDCVALPKACGDAPSCACLMDLEFCFDCEATPDGGLSLSCVKG